MADDAFGGEEYQGDGPEVFETGQATPQGEVLEVDEADQGPAGGGGASWLDSIEDADLREQAGKYGSATELARAASEAQRKLGEQGNDIGQLRQMVTELMSGGGREPDYGPQPPQPQGQQQPLSFQDVDEYARWTAGQVRNGEMEPEEAMAAIAQAQSRVYQEQMDSRMAAIEQQVEERLSASLAPVQSFQTQQAMGSQIVQMKRQYGEEGYAGLAPAASEYLRQWGASDPSFVQQPGAIQTAFDRAAADAYREGKRSAEAHTLDGSGPGQAPRNVDPAALILEGIENAGAHVTGTYF